MKGMLIQPDDTLRRRIQRTCLLLVVMIVVLVYWSRDIDGEVDRLAQPIMLMNIQLDNELQAGNMAEASRISAEMQQQDIEVRPKIEDKLRFKWQMQIIIISIAILLLALWPLSTAVRVLRAKQYPAPGMSVLRETYVVTGGEAMQAAAIRIVAGLLVLAAGAYVVLYIVAGAEAAGIVLY